jgi:hypothetical protein
VQTLKDLLYLRGSNSLPYVQTDGNWTSNITAKLVFLICNGSENMWSLYEDYVFPNYLR